MKLDDLNKSTICAQPWFGVTIKPDGTAGICCEVTEELHDMNVRTHSFEQMQNHPKIIKMKNEMVNGEKPAECWRCFSKEEHGATSLRHTLNKSYIDINKTFDPSFVAPQNIEIVLGNLCQLRCVMCHPSRSKKIANVFEHIVKMDFRQSYKESIPVEPINFDVSWVEDTVLWDSIAAQSKDARRIYLNGGEPLLAKHHEKVLQRLIGSGAAKDTQLIYSTNGFLMDDNHIALWRNFDQVSISFSIDDLEDRNHFIRNPSNWDAVRRSLDNVVRWQKDPSNKPINIGIWCAINMLSFAYLAEYLEFFAKEYPTIAIKGWRAIQTPNYLNPSHLPQEEKNKYAADIFAVIDRNPQFSSLRNDIEMIVNSIPSAQALDDGIQFMKLNADFYKIDLAETFPKLKHLIDK